MLTGRKLGADHLRKRGFLKDLLPWLKAMWLLRQTIFQPISIPEYYTVYQKPVKQRWISVRPIEQEAADFEQNPDAELFIRFEDIDDTAKRLILPVQNIEHLKLMVIRHLYNNNWFRALRILK